MIARVKKLGREGRQKGGLVEKEEEEGEGRKTKILSTSLESK
jgi:hypothetical protein